MKWIVIATAFMAMTLLAGNVKCPYHYGSSCWPNGKISPAGARGYSCSCGDEVWAGS